MIHDALPYHLEQLSRLCAEHPLERKVVFVPSRQVGHNLGTALAAAGHSWINLHLTTPADWASRIVGARLRAAGWHPLIQDADLFFVQSVVRGTTWPPEHPFASGFSLDGMVRSYVRTIRVLRASGVEADRLGTEMVSERFLLPDLYRRYCEWLSERRLLDQAHLFREAAAAARSEGVYAICDETSLPGPAFAFVRAASGGRIVRIGRAGYDRSPPPHYAASRFPDAPLVGADLIGATACGDPTHSPTAATGNPVGSAAISLGPLELRLRCSVGVENEVRGVLRELQSTGTPLDRVEIAYATEDPYLSLIVDTADRLGIPFTSSAGLPVTITAPGQALMGYFRWMADAYDPDVLVRLLRGRLIVDRRAEDRFDPSDLGRRLKDARVGRDPTAWCDVLDRFEAARSFHGSGTRSSRIEADSKLHGQKTGRRILERIVSLTPLGATSLHAMCRAGIAFMDAFAAVRTERDVRAEESLRDRLSELAAGDVGPTQEVGVGGVAPASELADTLADLLVRHKIEASIARPGHLYVVPLRRSGYAGRSDLIVLGLSETSFPGAPADDPNLLDEERGLLSADLPLERSRPGESVWQLLRVLSTAPVHATLVANRRETIDGRESYPAAFFQHLADQVGARRIPVFQAVPAAVEALDDVELVLAVRRRADVLPALTSERPWLLAGHEAERARRNPQLGRYDGWLGGRTPDLRPGPHMPISASKLEDLATCAYRYFLKHVLRIRPRDAEVDVPGRWLTPLEFGSLLHGVFKEFMEELAARGERVDANRHAGLMVSILDRHVTSWRRRVQMADKAAYVADVRRLERAVRIFLNEESRRDVEPIGFEVSFGLGKTGGLNRADPVEIRLSEDVVLMLRGSIDRIDRTDQGYEIWDYKTGSTYDFDENDLFSGGRRLQWALYACVLEELLGGRATSYRSGYFFTTDRELGLRLADVAPSRAALAERLRPLLEMVEEGAFLHFQKSKACTYCDFCGICASERRGSEHLDDALALTPGEHGFVEPLRAWMRV